MAARVTWRPDAVDDIHAIADYISRDSPTYAAAVTRKLLASGRLIERFPRAGRVVPEWNRDDLRQVVVYRYRVIYHLRGDEAVVIAVIHGARQLPAEPDI